MDLKPIGASVSTILPELTGRASGKPESETSPVVARQWLIDRTPTEVDQALRTSLRSTLKIVLQEHKELRFPVEGGYRSELVAFSVIDPDGNAAAALARVEAALTPAETQQVQEWLVALQAATAGAKRSEVNMRVAYGLYTGALMRFPADIAKAVCEHFALKSKWFPVLADVVEHCERLANPRFKMAEALRNRIQHHV